jgi:hypothetical protein
MGVVMSVYEEARRISGLLAIGGLGASDVVYTENSAKTDSEKMAAYILRAVYEGAVSPDALDDVFTPECVATLYGRG